MIRTLVSLSVAGILLTLVQPPSLHEPDVEDLPLLRAGHAYVPHHQVEEAALATEAVAAGPETLPLLQRAVLSNFEYRGACLSHQRCAVSHLHDRCSHWLPCSKHLDPLP